LSKVTVPLLVAACGGPAATSGAGATAAPVSDNAPGWARAGDSETGDGHRFICEAQASSEDEALSAANGICDSKICQLCGVEVESVVRTEETLTGVEFSRQVVERCRRVRKADTAPERKMVDCGPNGCTAWIQVFYSKEAQESECSRFSDENFADPAACQNTIEAFKNVAGYSAASFRERVKLIDDAISQCAEIDVRPTPLMGSLDKKLKVGMSTFREGRLPRYLKSYWLADYGPMWQTYEESDRFVERLRMLRKYLAHKVLIMDVIEASTVDAEQLDTPEGLAALMKVMGNVSRDEAFGTQHVHMFALAVLGSMHRAGQLTVDTGALNSFIRGTYPADAAANWNQFMDVVKLFHFDGQIDQEEWDYILGVRDWKRGASELLNNPNHGASGTRMKRFQQALERALAEKPKDRFRAFKSVICWTSCAELVLDVEKTLPKDIQAGYDWGFLHDVFTRTDDDMSKPVYDRFTKRMVRALAEEKDEKKTCTGLAGQIEKLDELDLPTDSLDGIICRCLKQMSDGATKNLVNKSELYDRAIDRNLTCVRPAS
jgi:hypothetical protein